MQLAQHVRLAAGSVGLRAEQLGGGLLGPPVELVRVPLLGNPAGPHPGDVGGRHVHDVRPGAGGPHCLQQGQRAGHVGAKALVDRRVEADLTSAVHDHVDACGQRAERPTQLSFDDVQPAAQQRVDGRNAVASAQRGKGRLAQQVRDPGCGAVPRPAADHDRHPGVGQVCEHPLEQRLPDEAGRPRDEHVRTRQTIGQSHPPTLVRRPGALDRDGLGQAGVVDVLQRQAGPARPDRLRPRAAAEPGPRPRCGLSRRTPRRQG